MNDIAERLRSEYGIAAVSMAPARGGFSTKAAKLLGWIRHGIDKIRAQTL